MLCLYFLFFSGICYGVFLCYLGTGVAKSIGVEIAKSERYI